MANPEASGSIVGEDVWFCNLIRSRGHKIVVDTSMILGHLGEHVFSDSEFKMAYEDGMWEKDEQRMRVLLKEAGE